MSKTKLKSIDSVVRRIGEMGELSPEQLETVQHMIESVVRNRDNVIKKLKCQQKPRKVVLDEKRVSGALRATIEAHGPIDNYWIGSASKRIVGYCQQVIES